MSSRLLRDQRGFTLVEVVSAVAVLFVLSMGTVTALNFAARSTRVSATRSTALNLANQRLEQIRNLPYDNVGVTYATGGYGDPPGTVVTPETVDDRFTVETDVGWMRDPDTHRAEYKKVTVTVSWEGSNSGSVAVSSNVFGKSSLVNTGDLSVDVRDLATDDHLKGAWVTVTPESGTAHSVLTGDDGEAFFGYLPSGQYAVTIEKDGYLFDNASLAEVNVAADLLTNIVAYGQVPSSVAVRTLTEDGSPLAGAAVTLSRPQGSTFSATTGADGRVRFDDLIVDTYDVSATFSGRSPASAPVNVAAGGETYEVELTLVQRSGLTVRIIDSMSMPMASATVSVRGPYPSESHAPGSPADTGANGEVTFDSLASGTYTIYASESGFYTASAVVAYDGSSSDPQVLMLWPVQYGDLVIHTVDRRGRDNAYEWVTVTGPNGYFQQVRTNSSGYRTIYGLVTGTYTVTPQGQGSARTVSIEAGETSVVEVEVR